jgi:hypothetical protein
MQIEGDDCELVEENMKVVCAALIAGGLLAVAAAFDPCFDPRLALPRSDEGQQAMLMMSNGQDPLARGRCCNDDFRQALPLSETPIDPVVTKP